MVNRKTVSAFTIAALLTCAIPAKSVASLAAPVLAQAVPTFDEPDSVAKGTNVRISSSSDNINAISEALGKGFEGKYSAKVAVANKDASAALQDVLNDNADLAAISRPLTAEEEAKGLIAVPVRREKIAIVVREDNPFAQSITGSQFAQIFRGEIKDWSEVGGEAGPIRLVDRPETSETRQSLKPYPVFTTAEFKTGDTAIQLSEDTTEALAKEIGANGIGYVLVDQLEDQSALRAIELHKTPPSDPRYPFSQPYSFVYAGGASPAVAAFLGYATGTDGQTALEAAALTGYSAAPASETRTEAESGDGTEATDGTVDETAAKPALSTPEGAVIGGVGSLNADGNLVDMDGNLISPEGYRIDADGNFVDADGALLADGTEPVPGVGVDVTSGISETPDSVAATADEAADDAGRLATGKGRWWWLLLPLAGLGLLIWAAGKRGAEEETGYSASTGGKGDDRIRSSFRSGNAPNPKSGPGLGSIDSIDTENVATSVGRVGQAGTTGVNRTVAGETALAGGVAAAGAGLAGRVTNKTGDVTTGLEGIKGSVQDDIGGLKGSTKGGPGNLRSNIQGSVDNARTTVQGGIDGIKGKIQGSADEPKEGAQGSIDGIKSGTSSIRSNVQGNIDGARTNLGGAVDRTKSNLGSAESEGSWLDRAKQRINQATDQVKDTTSNIKDDITDNK